MTYCVCCSESVPEVKSLLGRCAECNKLVPTWSSTRYCMHCRKEGLTLYRLSNCQWFCAECVDSAGVTCSACNELRIDVRIVKGISYCRRCYTNRFVHCSACGKRIRIAQVRGTAYLTYCQDCVPSTNYSRCLGSLESNRAYGVEIECDSVSGDPDYSVWDDKAEHCGTEYISGLLQGDPGLDHIIQFYIDTEPVFNDECGLHVHVDVRDFNDEQLLDLIRALKDTKDTWFDYVDCDRHDNEFCYEDLPEITPYDGIVNVFDKMEGTRYHWVNFHSIRSHGSVEFRLHEATEDFNKVVKWITMIVNFVSDVKDMSVV